MNLAEILKFFGAALVAPDLEVADLRLDSRQVRPGDVFLAVHGGKHDGRDFVAAALANGAAVVLVDSEDFHIALPIIRVPQLKQKIPELAAFFYRWPAEFLRLIGVTGTNGKSSIAHYIAQMFGAQQISCGIMGTLGNGWFGHLVPSNLTTADSCSINRELAGFLHADTKYVAMEVSSHALDQRRLDLLKFSAAVFSNLTQDHLDYHGDMETYFAAKSKLFADFYPPHRIINLDDPFGERLLRTYGGLSYSLLDPRADVYSDGRQIFSPWGQGEFSNPLLGKFNLSNILACVGVGGLLDLDFAKMLASIETLQAVSGRMQKIANNAGDPLVIVDYAHTPDALVKSLRALEDLPRRKIYCVFGCGGDRDRGKRPLMLAAALAGSDQVILTQDNPRTEDPQQIMADILSSGGSPDKISIIMDRAQAIAETISQAQAEDIVLIAGKGHEDYQIIGTEKRPFSDAQVAQAALARRSERVW